MLIKAVAREREAILKQGIEIGKEIGIAAGKEIGKEIGIAAGKEQYNRQLVQAMGQKGFALLLIAEITQLSAEDVQRFLAEAETDKPAATSALVDPDGQ